MTINLSEIRRVTKNNGARTKIVIDGQERTARCLFGRQYVLEFNTSDPIGSSLYLFPGTYLQAFAALIKLLTPAEYLEYFERAVSSTTGSFNFILPGLEKFKRDFDAKTGSISLLEGSNTREDAETRGYRVMNSFATSIAAYVGQHNNKNTHIAKVAELNLRNIRKNMGGFDETVSSHLQLISEMKVSRLTMIDTIDKLNIEETARDYIGRDVILAHILGSYLGCKKVKLLFRPNMIYLLSSKAS